MAIQLSSKQKYTLLNWYFMWLCRAPSQLIVGICQKTRVASLWHLCHISQVQKHTHSGSVTMSKCKQLLVRFKSGRPNVGLLPACGSLLIRFNCKPHLKTVRRFCVVSIWWWFLFSYGRQWRHLNPILHLRPTQDKLWEKLTNANIKKNCKSNP